MNADELFDYINTNTGYDRTNNNHICWSGGYDSTLVLEQLLESNEDNEESVDRYNIFTYSIMTKCLGDIKIKKEKECRKKYLRYASKKYKRTRIVYSEIEPPYDHGYYAQTGAGNHKCPQPIIWLNTVIPIIPDKSHIYFGYIKGDCFWSYGVFKRWAEAFTATTELFGKSIYVHAPLMHTSKYQIVREIHNRNIKSMVWTCETPTDNGKPCGRCEPCIKLTGADAIDFKIDEITEK